MPSDSNVNYRAVARRKALKYGLDPDIFVRQIGAESGYDPDVIFGRRVSSAGAQGIAQIMPATARGWGVNPLKPRHALDAAAKNMAAYVKRYGSYENALRAYNAGPGAIQASRDYAETNAYVAKILGGRDPGKLNDPRSPGRPGVRGGNGGGNGGGQTTLSEVVGSPGAVIAPPSSVLMDLLAQPERAQTPVSAPSPMMQGADRYLRNAVLGEMPSAGAPAPVQQGGLASQLAALGGAPSIVVPPSSQRVSVTGTRPGAENGPVGKTLVIGDSLQVGTFPLLKQMLGRKVKGVFVGGKPSTWGIEQLRREFRSGKYQNVVFDMGTNDATVDELRSSLRQLTKIAGGAKVYVSTVNSPWDEGEKNRLLRTYARKHPNVELIRWHKASKGGSTLADGIHGGYEQRASLLADALGYQASSQAGPKGSWGVKPRGQLLEMFYNGPGNAVNVKNGSRVGKGFVDGHGSHVHVGGNPRTVVEIGRMAQRMGLTVRENKAFDPVDPVHVEGSLHYSNQAADISGDPRKMAALTRRVARLYGI